MLGGVLAVVLDDGLYRVPQELADDILQVCEDVWECHVQMAVDADLGDRGVRPVSGANEVLCGMSAPLDDVPRYALQEDLADELGLGQLGAGREPVRVERLA